MPALRNPARPPVALTENDYLMLAAFRRTLREFLHFSERAAVAAGLRPRQHQALLAVRGTPTGQSLTVGDLAAKLLIRHHSAVGLVNRMEAEGLLRKKPDPADRRRILLALTPRSRQTLGKLTAAHKAELARVGPVLQQILTRLRVVR